MSDIPADVLLTVEPDDREDFPGHFAVVPHVTEREQYGRPILRSFTSKAAAWHMACMRRYEATGTLPTLSPGGMFPAPGGWTSDPRFADETDDREGLTPEEIQSTEHAVIEFIRKRMGDHMSDDTQQPETTEDQWDYPEPEGRPTEDTDPMPEPEPEPVKPKRKRKTKAEREAEQAEQAQEPAGDAESDSESLSDDSGASAQPEDSEPAESVSEPEVAESDRHAYDNFAALAESAPSEQGRAFWQSKANALIK